MSNIVKAIQKIYPGIEGGFTYWETKQDGSPLDNPIDGLKWENTQYDKPLWGDIEAKLSEVILREVKDLKIAEIIANRKAFIYLPVSYKEKEFINSEKAGNNLQAAYSFIDEPINWLDINGNLVVLSLLEVKELISLMIKQRSTGYFLESTLIKQVMDLETIEEVEGLNITFN